MDANQRAPALAPVHGHRKLTGALAMLLGGEVAGQEVFHAHLHVLPRFQGDGFGFRFPEGYGRTPERRDLDRIADELTGQLAS